MENIKSCKKIFVFFHKHFIKVFSKLMFLGRLLTFLINYYFLTFVYWKNLTNALRVLIYKLFLEIEKTNVTKLFLQFFIFFIKIELRLS